MENKLKDCPVVVDLLPLYLERKISRESAMFVQSHLEVCDNCRKECQWMQANFVDEDRRNEAWNVTSEEWNAQREISEKRGAITHRRPFKIFSMAKHKLLLYGYLLLLTVVVVYCIADFIAW